MRRLLIDSSSILMGCLHACIGGENAYVAEFDGKEVTIPDADEGYELFLMSLMKTLKTLDMVPGQIILVKDGANSREVRRKFLATYKDRAKQAPEFYEEFNKLQSKAEDTLWSYGALSVQKEGWEADDLIAAIAKTTDHVIWSKDKDLIAAGNWYFEGEVNPDKFFGIKKEHIVVYKSLVGDPSDKIPGAKGFGERRFTDMVAKYGDEGLQDILDMLEEGSLDEIEEYVDEFPPFQYVLDSLAMVYASYKCAKFYHPGYDLDFQARFPATNGDLPEWDRTERLIDLNEYTNAFIDQFEQELKENKLGYVGFDIETYTDEESDEWGLANKSSNDKNPKLDVFGSHMTGCSITTGSNNQNVYYFPIEHAKTRNIGKYKVERFLDLIPDNLELAVHNSAFELPIVRKTMTLRFDRGWLPNVVDTQIEKNYVNENTSKALKFCSKTYLNYDQVTYEEVTKGRKMNELTGDEVLSYGCDDSVVTAHLHSLFRLIMDFEGTSNAFDLCERDSAYMFAESFLNGIRFDLKRLDELYKENRDEYYKLMGEVKAFLMKLEGYPGAVFEPAEEFSPAEVKRLFCVITGREMKTNVRMPEKLAGWIRENTSKLEDFARAVEDEDFKLMNTIASKHFEPNPVLDIASPKQKAELLYDYLGYTVRVRGKLTDNMRKQGKKLGNPKADEKAFKLAIIKDAKGEEEKEFLEKIIRCTELNTEESFYFNPYPKMPNPKDGMVHYGTGQSATTSKRNAPNGPNIGQVSKKSAIREVYIPQEDGMIWVSLDWSGQELRLTAYRSGCVVMRACYPWEGVATDIHSKTGSEITPEFDYDTFVKINEDDDHPRHKEISLIRRKAKTVNFGDVYGQTKMGLALSLLISEEEAQSILEAKARAFPGVDKWKKDNVKRFKRDGYTTSLLGARRHLVLDGSWKDEHEFRSGTNSDIQTPAAEQMKLAVSELWRMAITDKYYCYFCFPVHDELNFCVTREDAAGLIKDVHEVMVRPFGGMDLPIESSIEIGPNFGNLRNIGVEYDEEKIKEAIASI